MIEFMLNASTETNKNDEKDALAKMDLLNNIDSKLSNNLAATSDTIVKLLGTGIHALLGAAKKKSLVPTYTERSVDP